jgi:hypothetical protein
VTDEALRHDLLAAYGAHLLRRRRRRAIVVPASFAALAVTGAALGAAALLGWPAPLHVKKEIAAVDQGLPADLRLNPDVEHARAVAATHDATLYAASLRDGGSCSEIVTAGERGRGATCTTGVQAGSRALDVVMPFDDPAGPESPVVVVGGRVNAEAGVSLQVHYADGSSDPIPLGDDRYFLFDIPAAHAASVHTSGLELVASDEQGAAVGRATVPADWDDPAVPDDHAPLYVSTRSDESDFTKVYGLEGQVSAAGATRLELDYGDGTQAAIPIQADGSYEYTVPADRIGDFMQPRKIVALGGDGQEVASAWVAAVAYWHGRERSGS